MTKSQKARLDMFVRVRDFGAGHTQLFPESSTGSKTFQKVAAAVAAIDDHLSNHVLASTTARKVKATTRAAVHQFMVTLAKAARRITRPESGVSPFRMPQGASLKALIASARVFLEEAATRQEQFVLLGFAPTFISDFRTLVDALQHASDVRISSKTLRREAGAGITTAIAEGLDAIRDLEVVVEMATKQDPTAFAAWQTARRIEGLRSSSRKATHQEPSEVAPVTPLPAAEPVAAGVTSPKEVAKAS